MAIIGKWGLNWNANALVWPNWTPSNITWVDWKSNWAGSFNGSSSKIDLPSSVDSFANGSNSYSFFCIFKTSTTGTQKKLYSSVHSSATFSVNFGIFLRTDNKLNIVRQGGGWLWTELISNNTYTDWLYHFVCATYNWVTKDFSIITDKETKTVTSNFNAYTNPGNPKIWYYLLGGGFSFNWIIDEVEIHDTLITLAEIKNKTLFYNWFI
jgi:hypothetical protein